MEQQEPPVHSGQPDANSPAAPDPLGAPRPANLSIAAVERDTGIGKDTLRAWERRYGFPTPERDAHGERSYPLEQVDKLRLMRRLIDGGHRPGKIAAHSIEALEQLSQQSSATPKQLSEAGTLPELGLDHYLSLIKQHDLDGLRASLTHSLQHLGLARFVQDVVAPLNGMVGDAWLRGTFETYEEHFYTEAIQTVLRNAISEVPQSAPQLPRVLLTTVPLEAHGLGLLMAEALLALAGCKCLSLGTQTPISDIVRACAAQRADIVALSFTASLAPNTVLDSLAELRSQLPANVAIWTGGKCPVLQRKLFEGITTISGLAALPAAVAQWRAAQHE